MDLFNVKLRGPNGQLRWFRFKMLASDQRSVTTVACERAESITGIKGWSPLEVVWLKTYER